jgi:hypothetical protein
MHVSPSGATTVPRLRRMPFSVNEGRLGSRLTRILLPLTVALSRRHVRSRQIMACESDLTPADLLYLFCTCTAAFCRFSPIEPIEFSKSFENPPIEADRLPPPPKPVFSDL